MHKLLLFAAITLALAAPAANATPNADKALSVVLSGRQGGVLSPYLSVRVTLHNLLKRPTWPQNVRVALRSCSGEQDRLKVAWANRHLTTDAAGQSVWSLKLPAGAKRGLAMIVVLPPKGGTTFCVRLHVYTNASAQPLDLEQQFQIAR